jgi:hypothetical protein
MDGALKPETVSATLNTMITTIILGLHPQLASFRWSEGRLPPDDMVRVFSKEQYETIARPLFTRILGEFDGLIRIHHINSPFVRGRRFARNSTRKQRPIGAGCAQGIRLPDDKRGQRRR